MGLPEVTYEDFTAAFGDAATSGEFSSCLPFAKAVVSELIFPNEPETDGQAASYRYAVCAAVLADASRGCGHGSSLEAFTVGSFSVSGGSGASGGMTESELAMRRAAARFLVGSGLLYKGVGDLR